MNSPEHPFSWQAIGRIVIAGVGLYLVWKAMGAIVDIMIALMLATALHPIVLRLNKRLPFALSTLLIVFLLFLPFIILVVTVIPQLVHQVPDLLKTIDAIVHSSRFLPPQLRNIDLIQYAQSGGAYLLQSTNIVTGAIASFFTILFLTFYFIFDAERLQNIFLALFSRGEQKKIRALLSELAQINGQYIRGNLLISLICGTVIFAGLFALQMPFTVPLALFAAFMDLLPLIGPTLGMIPALIIGFAISPLTGFLVLVLYLLYQQVENVIIYPAIYNKALNLSPALSFLSVIIGSSLFGIVGAFVALPVAASLPALIEYTRGHLQENTA